MTTYSFNLTLSEMEMDVLIHALNKLIKQSEEKIKNGDEVLLYESYKNYANSILNNRFNNTSISSYYSRKNKKDKDVE